LCRQLKVGRTSIREAVRVLHALGLVEVLQGKGTYVRAIANQFVPYSAWPETFHFTVSDVLELRLAIEPRAARLAAIYSDSADLESIETALREMQSGMREHDLAALVLADWNFHQRVVGASKNPFFVDVMKRTAHVQIETLRVAWSHDDRSECPLDFHRKILDAIRVRDPDRAYEAMEAHVLDWADEMRLQPVPCLARERFRGQGKSRPVYRTRGAVK
jgi:GntR family transcriptional repressor for pyruvate dehydrogenase complex